MKDKKDERQDEARQFDEAEGETVKSGEMTKEGGGREERERERKARPRKISTTAGDSFYTYTRTVLRSIEPKRSITSSPCLPPSPSPPIFLALRIARYIDGIRRSDRFKRLDR